MEKSDPWAFQRWAFHVKTGNPTRKAVLSMLAMMADMTTGRCEVRQQTLADGVEASKETVGNHLKALEEMGVIARRQQKRFDGGRRNDEFLLRAPGITEWPDGRPLPPLEKTPPPPDFEGGTPEKTGGLRTTSLGTTTSTTQRETGVAQQLQQELEPEVDDRVDVVAPLSDEETKAAAVRRVFDHWVQVTNPKRKVLTPSRERTIARALNEGEPELLMRAIDGMIAWDRQRGGGTPLSRCLQSRPGGSPLGETIEWWAEHAPSQRSGPVGFKPSMPPGITGTFAASVRSQLEGLQAYHRNPASLQAKDRATAAVAWLETRGLKVGRNPDGSPYIEEKAQAPA